MARVSLAALAAVTRGAALERQTVESAQAPEAAMPVAAERREQAGSTEWRAGTERPASSVAAALTPDAEER